MYSAYGATQYDVMTGNPGKRSNHQGVASPRSVFVVTGVILLVLLSLVPVWNACALMSDSNYTYWVGYAVPTWMIFLCTTIVLLYAVTVTAFFSSSRPQVQTEQTIMMIANVFISLLGLVLMLVSLPLSRQSIETYNNLMHRCDYSEQTHRLYEYSQVLQNIRSQPECMNKFSVEECSGYEESYPYTNFLKSVENDFRCTGFCYRSPASLLQSGTEDNSTQSTAAANKTAVATVNSSSFMRHVDHVTPLSLISIGAKAQNSDVVKGTVVGTNVVTLSTAFMSKANVDYPPTLFSDANYQASCEGMAARDMKNFAGDIGFQTFYQGIYLVLIAIATGFLKLVGFCVRKDHGTDF